MKAVVIADRLGAELAPLTDRTCVALLPVVAKPVIEHSIEALTDIGVREAIIVVSAYSDQVQNTLGSGSRWGMQFDYVLTRGEEAPAEIIRRLSNRLEDEFLVLRGDVLRSAVLHRFLERAQAIPGNAVAGVIDKHSAGLCLCRDAGAPPPGLGWHSEEIFEKKIFLENAALSRLESLAAYHRANLDAAAGRFPGLLVPGRQTALGLSVGRHSKVSPRSLKQGKAFVGAECRIHSEAELLGEVVISDHVIVDRHATLRDTVVLSHTYVGELVELNNAVVRSNDLIRVDTGAVVHIVDTFLLADLQTATLTAGLAGPVNRWLGFGLLILSLPLWLIGLGAALLHNPSAPLQRRRLRGNRVEFDQMGMRNRVVFDAWEFDTPVPLLRHLPKLWAVAAGHLRLIGTVPLTPEQAEARTEDWEQVADQAPAGLLGPTQLNVPADAPAEERLLSDAFYARQRSTGKDVGHFLQALGTLFSRRAWCAEPTSDFDMLERKD